LDNQTTIEDAVNAIEKELGKAEAENGIAYLCTDGDISKDAVKLKKLMKKIGYNGSYGVKKASK
jgi:hypothetical protein